MTSTVRVYTNHPDNQHTLPLSLSEDQLIFWTNFTDYLPYDRHRGLQGYLRHYIENPEDIISDYHNSQNNEPLLSKIDTCPDYRKAISEFDKIFIGGKREGHFLMTVLLGNHTDWNISFERDKLTWNPTPDSIGHSIICSQLALVVDFMTQPTISSIYPHIAPFKPQEINGKLVTHYR